MDTAIVTSLWSSFKRVPPAAIPAMLDCIISSTNTTPSSLFSSLLSEFPNLIKEINQGSEKLDTEQQNFIGSYVGALCHIMKKSGANVNMQSFLSSIFIPLMKFIHTHREVFNEVAGLFFDAVIQTDSWNIVETAMVPVLLGLIRQSIGLLHSDSSSIYKSRSSPTAQSSYDMLISLQYQDLDSDINISKHSVNCLSEPLPLHICFHLLTFTLDAALRSKNITGNVFGSNLADGFAGNLVWDLWHITKEMLSESQELRSSAITFCLPFLFNAFVSHYAHEVSIGGQDTILSRNNLLMELWKCCKVLFTLGPLERRDAYAIISLYVTFFPFGDVGCGEEIFDIRADNELWVEIKRGLVDKESLVRKQSLHILKATLFSSEDGKSSADVSEAKSEDRKAVHQGMTKRGRWADKEAKSMGVGKLCNSTDLSSRQKWEAFILLYEMLEEYGTHLVEAAWNHQITLLLHSSSPSGQPDCSQHQMETLEEVFEWLSVLWQRGFCHDNPQVRCLIMQSFLGINWKNDVSYSQLVPKNFILVPLIQGLNDPVHHKDFGMKEGVYSSFTIEAAVRFLCQYTSHFDRRNQVAFLINLASAAKKHSFGRAGLMCLAECISSAAAGFQKQNNHVVGKLTDASPDITRTSSLQENSWRNDKVELLDILRFIIESTKQHFNSNYRRQVCEKILDAAVSVMTVLDAPLESLLHFISSLPREFTDFGGALYTNVRRWLMVIDGSPSSSACCSPNPQLLEVLGQFPRNFVSANYLVDASFICDDEDLDAWESEASRFVRLLFLMIQHVQHFDPVYKLIQDCGTYVGKENSSDFIPVKFFILLSSLVQELQVIKDRMLNFQMKRRLTDNHKLPLMDGQISSTDMSYIFEKFSKLLLSLMEGLILYSNLSSSIFWSSISRDDCNLPGSIRGRLGGPSQRRLSLSTITPVLQGIISLKTLASVTRWCAQFEHMASLNSVVALLWSFSWKVVECPAPAGESEIKGEIGLAAYEALAHALKTLAYVSSPFTLHFATKNDNSSPSEASNQPMLDSFALTLLQNVNDLIREANLTRARRAVLINLKWICLESLLSIPNYAFGSGVHSGLFFSAATVRGIFDDLVDNLENAGENSVLPMLRSVRLLLELFASGRTGTVVSSCDGITTQMMWNLVRASWILHVSCNKRRVAPIAALLSSVVHYSVFTDESMHQIDDSQGPLKWFVEKILEEGTRSPRTIRLAALHLTGLWLSSPSIIQYYMKELRILTMYGSVAFDEDFEAELAENQDAKIEVSKLAGSPDPELTDEFINTELYARVCVAVLFDKLANTARTEGLTKENAIAAIISGKTFLLELLDFVVNDKELSKELYKKYSAIHRRKVRAWQMLCVLSQYIDQDIIQDVTCSLHTSLSRNNLPSVRQYLETFAIHIYLNFPSVVRQQLVPFLRKYDMRPQALSSYVFIAANVILHANKEIQSRHLNDLLPPIIPLLTSHHHTLRGFTQLLVYKILQKLWPPLDSCTSSTMSVEKRCFEDIKLYLTDNLDCARLRASMEGYLDAFDPKNSVTPAGVFTNRVEDLEFECVPATLLDRVISFLNDAREDLRCSMANDLATIKNESLKLSNFKSMDAPFSSSQDGSTQSLRDMSLDFQKKVTLSKHEIQDTASVHFLENNDRDKLLMDIEKEDQILNQLLHARRVTVNKLKESRQQFILVASLIDRIPNLAGLARTCEVFRAAGLAIADSTILSDKQFQLISVTAEKWVPILEVPVNSMKVFLEKKKQEGFAILGLEQTANSIPLDQHIFPTKTVLVLGREKEGIPVEIIHILDACIEIPQLGVVRSLNVHVSGAIALWEYTRQQRSQ